MAPKEAVIRIAAFFMLSPFISLAEQHHYAVTVDAGLNSLSVVARLAPGVSSIAVREDIAPVFTDEMRYCHGDKSSNQLIRVDSREIKLKESAAGVCLQYTFDLGLFPRTGSREYVDIDHEKNRAVSPGFWLWLPPIKEDTEIIVRFALPEKMNVSVPWEKMEAGDNSYYRFGQSPRSKSAVAIFGDFDYEELHIPGATLRVSIIKGKRKVDKEKILRWLRAAAMDVTLAYSRFPNPSPQIVVIPVKPGADWGGAVPFGHVIRDGGEAIEYFINPAKPLSEFLDDWTATHEFSHLMLPYVTSRQSWVSEGFASYYQNVLLARAGVYSQRKAWQKLYRGFNEARKTGADMTPNTTGQYEFWTARMMIYWSGAAMALMADMKLRERSNNKESLDTVLEKLQTCCLPSDRVWTGAGLFDQLDKLTEKPLFVEIYNRYANKKGVLDFKSLYEQLGIEIIGESVRLKDRGELIHIREAIMQVDGDFAGVRGSMN